MSPRNAIYLDAGDWHAHGCASDLRSVMWARPWRVKKTMFLELVGEGTIWAWGVFLNDTGKMISALYYAQPTHTDDPDVVLVKRIIHAPPPAVVWRAFEKVGVRPWAMAPGRGPRGIAPWARTPGVTPP